MTPQTRTLRAELNRILQPCITESHLRAECAAFAERHGKTIWHIPTGIGHEETFLSHTLIHLGRIKDDEAFDERARNILSEIENCGEPVWWNIKGFIENRPDLQDRTDVIDALEDRRIYLEIAEEE